MLGTLQKSMEIAALSWKAYTIIKADNFWAEKGNMVQESEREDHYAALLVEPLFFRKVHTDLSFHLQTIVKG